MENQLSNEILMKKLANGDKRSASVLYDRNYKNVYGYFFRMTKNADASRDLTQNVFVKILKYSHSWKEDKTFSYWLFRIARNILIDYFNENKKFYGEEDNQQVAEFDQEESMRVQDTKEKFEFLLDALSQLPPTYREMIELNRFQGFSYKEIAATISSTENAVKVKTFRAIQKLKEIYTNIIMD